MLSVKPITAQMEQMQPVKPMLSVHNDKEVPRKMFERKPPQQHDQQKIPDATLVQTEHVKVQHALKVSNDVGLPGNHQFQMQLPPSSLLSKPSGSRQIEHAKSEKVLNKCIRQGCNKQAIEPKDKEWKDEYCSQMCVILHCRTVFANFQELCQSNNVPSLQ